MTKWHICSKILLVTVLFFRNASQFSFLHHTIPIVVSLKRQMQTWMSDKKGRLKMGHVDLGNGLESIKIQSQHILQMLSQVTSVYFHDRSWIAFQCWTMDVFVFISFSVNFWCILGRGVFLSFWHEAFVYLIWCNKDLVIVISLSHRS